MPTYRDARVRSDWIDEINCAKPATIVVYVGNSKMANIYDFRGILISAPGTTGDSNVRALLAHARAQSAHVCNANELARGQRTNESTRTTHKVLSHSGMLRTVFTL